MKSNKLKPRNTVPTTVICASCFRENKDEGKRGTCAYCGMFPLPSYSYDLDSSFHPTNCKGEVKSRAVAVVKAKTPERVTPKPSILRQLKQTKKRR